MDSSQSSIRLFSIHVVAAAADEHGAGRLVDDVAENDRPAGAVVEVHALGAVQARTVDVVDEVVSDHVAADRPIAAGVEDAHVARLLANVVDFVQLHHVLVAEETDGPVRGVVDEVMSGAVAHALELNRRQYVRCSRGKMMDVVVDHVVAGGRQRAAVAAVDADAGSADLVDVAARPRRSACRRGRPRRCRPYCGSCSRRPDCLRRRGSQCRRRGLPRRSSPAEPRARHSSTGSGATPAWKRRFAPSPSAPAATSTASPSGDRDTIRRASPVRPTR